MPKKTVREMSEIEKKHFSIAAHVFHSVVNSSIVLGIVAFLVGLGMYGYALAGQYITESFQLAKSASAALQSVVDVAPMSERTMQLYRSQIKSELKQTGTEEYRKRFEEITKRPEYKTTLDVLDFFRKDSDVSDLYVAMYDSRTSAIVYIADPEKNPEYECKPGEWESVENRELNRFLNWNGEGQLYDIGDTDKYGWMCTAGVPVYNEDGKVVAFVLADITISNLFEGLRTFSLWYLLAIAASTIILAYITSKRMKRKLVQPINSIAEAAQSYVDDKRKGVTGGKHFSSLNIRTGDEIENLSMVMADMELELTDYVENLTRVTAEKERVSTELDMATKIQESMLPNIYPAFPDRTEFDVYAQMDPAKEVGGDFFDYFLVDDDHLCLVMADVSGKGIPAALFMMASKIILQNNAMTGKSPAQILTDTNNAICSNNQLDMFVTVWLGILEISTGKLTAANAGHEYPTIKTPDGGYELYKDKHGFVIGGMSGIKYKEYELTLKPGSKLFVYTDGVPEATNPEEELFSTERMLEALNQNPDAGSRETLQNVRKAVDDFVRDAEQFDDLTMLCLDFKG